MNPLDIASLILGVGDKVLDKLFPDPAAKAQAQLIILQAQQKGELDMVNAQLSAIISDSKSSDPWTSRARPSFLYVVYILILSSIPMGVVSAIDPTVASAIVLGYKNWLNAIPDAMLQLFGVVMTGYIAGRSWEKVKGVSS